MAVLVQYFDGGLHFSAAGLRSCCRFLFLKCVRCGLKLPLGEKGEMKKKKAMVKINFHSLPRAGKLVLFYSGHSLLFTQTWGGGGELRAFVTLSWRHTIPLDKASFEYVYEWNSSIYNSIFLYPKNSEILRKCCVHVGTGNLSNSLFTTKWCVKYSSGKRFVLPRNYCFWTKLNLDSDKLFNIKCCVFIFNIRTHKWGNTWLNKSTGK